MAVALGCGVDHGVGAGSPARLSRAEAWSVSRGWPYVSLGRQEEPGKAEKEHLGPWET